MKQESFFEKVRVIDKLVVGPVKIESKRIITPYTVFRNDNQETMDLVYSYEEAVLDPKDITCQNLANMIGAQVALNYGLFCKSIIFHGKFDESDRRFLREMAENTAREIYVKKFGSKNVFLVKEFGEITLQKQKKYCTAKLKFPDIKSFANTEWKMWENHPKRHAILSSGGKDSLLTYGLLNEIGQEVYPIYLNESGRHWFSALNAHRYFKENIPNTSKVWLNSDRIFAWMLRHLPFIRKDFANVRSDEYAIRLWTVAVFLFGALPILKAKGVNCLSIGDEFDTTNHTSTNGITHYDGLYDQSRYFDHALTGYFWKKGWMVNQFSVLRPLSELLIEKILIERYPNLQQHQISCHATHTENNKVYPCGKCEKCRRVLGMLVSLDADPTKCGYTKEQITECISRLGEKDIHQEAEGVEQLYFMLSKKEGVHFIREKKFKEHPEILQARFDSEHSPLDTIPTELREPLYRIYMEHANGAVRKIKNKWQKFDVFTNEVLSARYPFEFIKKDEKSSNYLWGEMNWKEAEKRFEEVDIAILPVGAIEQHGPHLPLDTDSFDANYLAEKVAEACSYPKPLVLPLISYGVSYHHDAFKGTISISNDTLAHLVYDIGMSVARNGIKKLVIINGHGGNDATLNHAAQMINRDSKMFICVDTGTTSDVDIYKFIETPNDVHAGEVETSTTMAIRPHLVKMTDDCKLVPKFSNEYLNFTSDRSISWHAHTEKFSPNGVMGDPYKASAEKGQKIWNIMVAHLVTLIENLKSLSLEEIYQDRY